MQLHLLKRLRRICQTNLLHFFPARRLNRVVPIDGLLRLPRKMFLSAAHTHARAAWHDGLGCAAFGWKRKKEKSGGTWKIRKMAPLIKGGIIQINRRDLRLSCRNSQTDLFSLSFPFARGQAAFHYTRRNFSKLPAPAVYGARLILSKRGPCLICLSVCAPRWRRGFNRKSSRNPCSLSRNGQVSLKHHERWRLPFSYRARWHQTWGYQNRLHSGPTCAQIAKNKTPCCILCNVNCYLP